MPFQAAFYKGTRPGMAGGYNRMVRAWEKGKYSHGELVFSDGMAGSSSLIDGGVRLKKIEFEPERWDFIPLPDHLEATARCWFELRHGKVKYDLWGQLRFIVMPIALGDDESKVWCTEAMAAALGMPESWRYGPNSLAAALQFMYLATLCNSQQETA